MREVHKLIAFVPQDDVLLPTLSVAETLWFSARLRLPASTPAHQLNEWVVRLIDLLGLTHVRCRRRPTPLLMRISTVSLHTSSMHSPSQRVGHIIRPIDLFGLTPARGRIATAADPRCLGPSRPGVRAPAHFNPSPLLSATARLYATPQRPGYFSSAACNLT
jgi:hypothetical protein